MPILNNTSRIIANQPESKNQIKASSTCFAKRM